MIDDSRLFPDGRRDTVLSVLQALRHPSRNTDPFQPAAGTGDGPAFAADLACPSCTSIETRRPRWSPSCGDRWPRRAGPTSTRPTSSGDWRSAAGIDIAFEAVLIGPSLTARELEVHAGDDNWGVEFRAHVFLRRVPKLDVLGEIRPLPTDGRFFEPGGVRFPVPSYDTTEDLVEAMVGQGVLTGPPEAGPRAGRGGRRVLRAPPAAPVQRRGRAGPQAGRTAAAGPPGVRAAPGRALSGRGGVRSRVRRPGPHDPIFPTDRRSHPGQHPGRGGRRVRQPPGEEVMAGIFNPGIGLGRQAGDMTTSTRSTLQTPSAPQVAIDELRRRLDSTRWPEVMDESVAVHGIAVATVRRLAEHWRTGFDWRAVEAELDRLGQMVLTTPDGRRLHAIHAKSPSATGVPLLLIHGWPDSLLRFTKLIPLLTAAGHDVVAPAIPGFGFSDQPSGEMSPALVAEDFAWLMGELGYTRYAAHGGDWGSAIATALTEAHPEAVVALHLTDVPWDKTFSIDRRQPAQPNRPSSTQPSPGRSCRPTCWRTPGTPTPSRWRSATHRSACWHGSPRCTRSGARTRSPTTTSWPWSACCGSPTRCGPRSGSTRSRRRPGTTSVAATGRHRRRR